MQYGKKGEGSGLPLLHGLPITFFKVLFKKDYKVSSIDKNAFWAGFPDIILEKTPLSLLIEL